MQAPPWTETDEMMAENERRLLAQHDCEAPPLLYRLPQPWLFRRDADEAFRGLGLSRADVAEWHAKGWLPSDLSQATSLEEEDYRLLRCVWELSRDPTFRDRVEMVLLITRLPPSTPPCTWANEAQEPWWSIPPEDEDDVIPGLFDERARRARRLLWRVRSPKLRRRLRAIGYADLESRVLECGEESE